MAPFGALFRQASDVLCADRAVVAELARSANIRDSAIKQPRLDTIYVARGAIRGTLD
jgi:hypothetical protein